MKIDGKKATRKKVIKHVFRFLRHDHQKICLTRHYQFGLEAGPMYTQIETSSQKKGARNETSIYKRENRNREKRLKNVFLGRE